MHELAKLNLKRIIDVALHEDDYVNDITTNAIAENKDMGMTILSKSSGILCGIEAISETLNKFRDTIDIKLSISDGMTLHPGSNIASINGRASHLLTAERVILNLMQHLSGVATITRQFVNKISGTNVKIAATRKTIPGLRDLQKYAVVVGGGIEHRTSLSSWIMIKDNHVSIAGSVSNAIDLVKATNHNSVIEVECDTIEQVIHAFKSKVNIILCDNMTPESVYKAKQIVGNDCILEVSGGISLSNVREYAETGVDIISVGRITHSVSALDISAECSSHIINTLKN